MLIHEDVPKRRRPIHWLRWQARHVQDV